MKEHYLPLMYMYTNTYMYININRDGTRSHLVNRENFVLFHSHFVRYIFFSLKQSETEFRTKAPRQLKPDKIMNYNNNIFMFGIKQKI